MLTTSCLPLEPIDLAAMFDLLPFDDQTTFHYRFDLMMVEFCKANLIQTIVGDNRAICTFRTNVGDVFTIPKPPISPEEARR